MSSLNAAAQTAETARLGRIQAGTQSQGDLKPVSGGSTLYTPSQAQSAETARLRRIASGPTRDLDAEPVRDASTAVGRYYYLGGSR